MDSRCHGLLRTQRPLESQAPTCPLGGGNSSSIDDYRVVLFAIGVTVPVSVNSGVVPALQATRSDDAISAVFPGDPSAGSLAV